MSGSNSYRSDTESKRDLAVAAAEAKSSSVVEAQKSLKEAKQLELNMENDLKEAQEKLEKAQADLEKVAADAEQAAVQAAETKQLEEDNMAQVADMKAAGLAALEAQKALKLELAENKKHAEEELKRAKEALDETVSKAKEADFFRAQTAERFYTVQALVESKKIEAKKAQEQAENDHIALVKLQHEKYLLDVQVNELKVKAEAVAEKFEQSEVDEPTGERVKHRFEARLANIEKVVHPEEEATSKCSMMSDADTDAMSETASQIAAKESSKDFRKRQALIGKGVSAKEAQELVETEASVEEEKPKAVIPTRQIVRPEDKPVCCGCSALFCSGLWCGIVTGLVFSTVGALAATGVSVHTAVATVGTTGSQAGSYIAGGWNSTVSPFFVSVGHSMESCGVSTAGAMGVSV